MKINLGILNIYGLRTLARTNILLVAMVWAKIPMNFYSLIFVGLFICLSLFVDWKWMLKQEMEYQVDANPGFIRWREEMQKQNHENSAH